MPLSIPQPAAPVRFGAVYPREKFDQMSDADRQTAQMAAGYRKFKHLIIRGKKKTVLERLEVMLTGKAKEEVKTLLSEITNKFLLHHHETYTRLCCHVVDKITSLPYQGYRTPQIIADDSPQLQNAFAEIRAAIEDDDPNKPY